MENRYPDESPGRLGHWRLQLARSAGTLTRTPSLRLLSLGAWFRLAGAALIVAVLWAGFFWAVFTPGTP